MPGWPLQIMILFTCSLS